MRSRSKALLGSAALVLAALAFWSLFADWDGTSGETITSTTGATAGSPTIGLAPVGTPPADSGAPADPAHRWSAWVRTSRGYAGEAIADAEVHLVDADGAERTGRSDASGIATFAGLPGASARVSARAAGFAATDEIVLEPATATESSPYPVALAEAESVAGTVVDAGTGRAIAGASVTALLGGAVCINPAGAQEIERVQARATTDVAGRFRLEGVKKDDFCALRIVRVDAVGYRTRWHVPQAQTGPGPLAIRLAAGGSIEGVVTDPSGKVRAGATVVVVLDARGDADPIDSARGVDLPGEYIERLRGLGDGSHEMGEDAFAALTAVSDAEGRFVVAGLGLGERYCVAAWSHPFGASETARDVRLTRESRTAIVSLRLREACRLTVGCTHSRGEPWPGLRVWLEGARGPHGRNEEAQSDARGVARFVGLTPGEYRVRVPDDIRGGIASPIVRAVPGEVEVLVPLPGSPDHPAGDPHRAPFLELARAQAAGTPAEDGPPRTEPNLTARVRVRHGVTPPASISERAKSGGSSAYSGTDWRPDSNGDVRIAWTYDDVPKFRFFVEAEGFLPIVRDVVLDANGKADLGTLVLEQGETIAGIVSAPDGEPLSGVLVQLEFPSTGHLSELERLFEKEADAAVPRHTRSASTGVDGSFRVAGLAPGPVAVRMRDPRFLAFDERVDVPLAKSPLRLVVRKGCVIRVRAVDGDGHPATLRGVDLYAGASEPGRGWEGGGTTDVEGTFSARVEPGTHFIKVAPHRGYASPDTVHSTITVEEGELREVRIVVPAR